MYCVHEAVKFDLFIRRVPQRLLNTYQKPDNHCSNKYCSCQFSGLQGVNCSDFSVLIFCHLSPCLMVVPYLRRLVTRVSPRRPRFDPRSFHVGYMVDRMGPGKSLLPQHNVLALLSFRRCCVILFHACTVSAV